MSDKPKLPEWLANPRPRWYMMRPFKNRGYAGVVNWNRNPFNFCLDDEAAEAIRRWLPDFDPDQADIAGLEALMLNEFGMSPAHIQELTWPNMLTMLRQRDPKRTGQMVKSSYQAFLCRIAQQVDSLLVEDASAIGRFRRHLQSFADQEEKHLAWLEHCAKVMTHTLRV